MIFARLVLCLIFLAGCSNLSESRIGGSPPSSGSAPPPAEESVAAPGEPRESVPSGDCSADSEALSRLNFSGEYRSLEVLKNVVAAELLEKGSPRSLECVNEFWTLRAGDNGSFQITNKKE